MKAWFRCSIAINISSLNILLLLILPLIACGSPDSNRYGVERLAFNVVDSLLSEAVFIEKANKVVCPPLGFTMIPDSLLAELKARQQAAPKQIGNLRLLKVLFDSTSSAGLLISEIPELSLAGDTIGFANDYLNALREFYGDDNIKTGAYVVNDVLVKNYLVQDSALIRFQLICLSEKSPAIELHYFTPRKYYTDLLPRIESSIGTIQLIRKEDEK